MTTEPLPHWDQLHELDCILAEDPEYSIKLYGAPGRVPKAKEANFNQLRMVWMSLLSKKSQDRLNGLGVCIDTSNATNKLIARNPYNPQSSTIPPASIWNHLPLASLSENGFPDNTWVEVTHCPVDPEHKSEMGFWFWAAAGSGISLNLGKTISLGFEPNIRKLRSWSIIHEYLTRYDSVQMLHRLDSSEVYVEIVLAYPGCGECVSLTNASAHVSERLRCGRDPYWIPCSNAKGTPLHLLDDCHGMMGLSYDLIRASPC